MKLVNVLPSFVLVLFRVLNVTAEVHFRHGGEPKNITVVKGDSAYFSCVIEGLDYDTRLRYRIDWNINGRFLSTRDVYSDHRYSVRRSAVPGNGFIVHHSHLTDRGYYYCVLYIDGRKHLCSKRGYLTVIQKPSFHHPLVVSVTVVEGQSVLLRCHIQNFEVGRFNISWFRNNVQLTQNDYISNPNVSQLYGNVEIIGRYIQTTSYDLQITNISRASIGRFHCSVYMGNREVLKSRFVWLYVFHPTYEQYLLCNPQTPELYSVGDTLRTTCRSQGENTEVDFFWMKGGKMTHAIRSADYLMKNQWTLTESDNGTYVWCSKISSAIFHERQCAIGPIKIHDGQASPDSSTKATHNTDKISSPSISSEAPLTLTRTLPRMATSQAQTRTRQISSPLMSSEATFSVTTILSGMFTSQAQTRALHFEVKPNKTMMNHLTCILTTFICLLIAVVVTITAMCVLSKKSSVRDNAIEVTNMDEFYSCRVTDTVVEENVHHEALGIIVNGDTAHYEK